MLAVWMLLLVPLAQAHDGGEVHVQAAKLRCGSVPMVSGSVRAVGDKDAYIGVEARVAPDERWIGRAGIGFDVLGGGDWDLKLGLFLGGIGTGLERERALITGTEVALGAKIGRLYGQYRWLGGLGTSRLAALHTEHELTVGVRLIDEFRVFGQLIRSDLRGREPDRGAGLGLAYRF